jgi:pseudomonalisin
MLARRSLAGAATAAIAVSALPLAAAQATTGTVVMTANVLHGISSLTPTGTPSSTVMTLGLGVARPNPAGEAQALHAMYDPHSASYRQFLSVADFAQRFGVPSSRRDAITSWLRGGGLHVFMVSAAGDLVMAQGTAQQVDSLFGVTEHTYSYRGASFIANDHAPTVPAGLGITTVMGLNTYQHASLPQRTAAPTAAARCYPANFCTGTLQAEDMWSIYDMPAGPRGKGQRVAILGEGVLGNEATSGSVIADLRQFENEHHFPHVAYSVHCVINGDCGSDTSGGGEWDLDQAASTGMAPDIDHLDYYFAQNLTDANQAAMIAGWLSDPRGPMQANASFSECEQGPYNSAMYALPGNVDGNEGLQIPILPADPVLGIPFLGPTGDQLGDNLEAYAEPALQSAAMIGRTLFAAAGDTGSGCTAVVADGIGPNGIAPENYPTNPYPAGARYAVAVAGTVLYRKSSDGATVDSPPTRGEEYAWPYTGGGSSPFLTAPDYQKNVTNLTGICVTDPDGGTGATGQLCRGVPDVAAMSGDIITASYADVSGGSDSSNGGTSLASPLWVGMWTRIQAASHLPRGLGFANETIYAIGKDATKYGRDFFDVTIGSNGGPCPQGPCIAQTGWDYVSGWGVPDVAKFIADTQVTQVSNVFSNTVAINAPGSGGNVQSALATLPNTASRPLDATGAMAALLALPLAAWSGRRRRRRSARP